MGLNSQVKPGTIVLQGMAMVVVILFIILMMVGAMAQSNDAMPNPINPPPATPAVTAPPPPPKFHLEIDQADLQAISQALNELPKKIADPLILKLNAQLQPDQQAKLKPGAQAAADAPTEPKQDQKRRK